MFAGLEQATQLAFMFRFFVSSAAKVAQVSSSVAPEQHNTWLLNGVWPCGYCECNPTSSCHSWGDNTEKCCDVVNHEHIICLSLTVC